MREVERLEKRIIRDAARAIADFSLIGPGDKIMVACSGGKDSYTLLHVLMRLRERAPISFNLVAVHLDQGQPDFPSHLIEAHFQAVGVPYRMVRRELWPVVKQMVPAGKTACALCSRFRRAVLYDVAAELGCSSIALGHHRDDFIETLLLNALYAGSLKAMPARLRSDDGRNTVIRPLCYAAEEEIAAFAAAKAFPIVPCDVCGSQPQLRRKRVKALLKELSAEHPSIKANLLHALGHVIPSHLLDRGLQGQLAVATGRDPWLEGEEEDAPTVALPTDGVVRRIGGK
jgi:tRNA 2-thiocytidine biosynthesis protein TtcA